MRAIFRCAVLAGLLCVFAPASASLRSPHRLTAQEAGVAFWDLGALQVSGTTWDFAGDFAVGAGAWESLTISNYGYCWMGPNDPRAGTAHAGAVYWFAELQPQAPPGPSTIYSGTLQRGTMAGQATVTTTRYSSGPVTHVQITISGSDLAYFQGDMLDACLLGSS